MIRFISAFLLFAFSFSGLAQNADTVRIIRGKVLEANDKGFSPLPGVSIHIKGTIIGTVSDVNGEFKLKVSNQKDLTLVFQNCWIIEKLIRKKDNQEIIVIPSNTPNAERKYQRWLRKQKRLKYN